MMAGILRHEAAMILRRKGVWVAYGALYAFYGGLLLASGGTNRAPMTDAASAWQGAGMYAFQFNMFMVLVAGIVAADTLERDVRTGVSELQRSTPMGHAAYLTGKYLGAVTALLIPYLLWVTLFGAAVVGLGRAPIAFVPALLMGFVALGIPAYAFVVAFSLACPLVMPVRVYQILFTGYWFWGNYLSPKVLPTLNGTLVTPSGIHMMRRFFGGGRLATSLGPASPLDAWLNLALLGLCVAAVFLLLHRYLTWRERQA